MSLYTLIMTNPRDDLFDNQSKTDVCVFLINIMNEEFVMIFQKSYQKN